MPNLFSTLTTVIINFAVAFLLVGTADLVTANNFRFINWLPEMLFCLYVVSGIFFDFTSAYLAHFTEHKISVLWMVHLVHHRDHEVNTTSVNRHYLFESVIRFFIYYNRRFHYWYTN